MSFHSPSADKDRTQKAKATRRDEPSPGRLDPLSVLKAALEDRCQKNPQYSIRAFARSSGISVTVLSLVLSGKRRLSKKATLKLADFLNLDPDQRRALLTPAPLKDSSVFNTLALDTFSVISDWHHYAILSALELPETVFEARSLSKQLGISPLDAKLAMGRLKSLELVEKSPNGKWVATGQSLKVENTVSTSATKKFHRQLLHKAAQSIDNDPISDRDFSSMTFAMDASLVEFARKRIQAFRRELTAELESKGRPTAVFQFSLQLFPLTPVPKTPTPRLKKLRKKEISK